MKKLPWFEFKGAFQLLFFKRATVKTWPAFAYKNISQ